MQKSMYSIRTNLDGTFTVKDLEDNETYYATFKTDDTTFATLQLYYDKDLQEHGWGYTKEGEFTFPEWWGVRSDIYRMKYLLNYWK